MFSDFWVEQGGFIFGGSSTISLTFPYPSTNYHIYTQWLGGKAAYFYASDCFLTSITTSSFVTNGNTNANVKQRNWVTYGFVK